MSYAGAHAFDVRFNKAAVEEYLFEQAIKAADRSANYAADRARKHAPVRKIFKGTRYRNDELFSRYTSPAGAGRVAISKRIRTPNDNQAVRLGHPNSNEPVFKTPTGNRVTGDFRLSEVGDDGVRRLRKVEFAESRVSRGGRLTDISRAGRKVSAESQLTGRGVAEVRSGRALFKTPKGESIGGRLRAGITVEAAKREGDQVWAHVVSVAKDPKTGYPYNRAMEFGTVHNRPYPYMRPGLAETEPILRREARSHLKSARR